MRVAGIIFVLVIAGCGSNKAASDAGDDPADVPPCIPDGGFYTCTGGSWPTCPIAVWAVVSPLAGATSACRPAFDATASWEA
jgi:hypothetical protein